MKQRTITAKEEESIRAYYRHPGVRARVEEFCGGKDFSCEYLVGFGPGLLRRGWRRPLRLTVGRTGLTGLMEEGLDLFRSVWDTSSTLAVWDVEYFNLDSWRGLYRDQDGHFALIEPAWRAITSLLNRYGVRFIDDTTASGYHFVSRIPFSSPVHARVESIGRIEESLARRYRGTAEGDEKRRRPVGEREALGYSGIGRLMEYLCHRVIAEVNGGDSPIPATISDTAGGGSGRGREGINLDITQYADPIYMRTIRTTFSTHQKHKVYTRLVGEDTAREVGVFAALPRAGLDYRELTRFRRDLSAAAEYSGRVGGFIPDAAAGWKSVLEDYLASPLHRFHADFDEYRPGRSGRPPELDPASLPPCVAAATKNPNPELLRPTNLRNLCRVLMRRKWHPRRIADYIRARYEEDHGWEVDWNKYHPEVRANFWSRVFCGMISTGLDRFEDFNCDSLQASGFCPSPRCGFSLAESGGGA